eukprot:5889049-Amphidinium_carterae.1
MTGWPRDGVSSQAGVECQSVMPARYSGQRGQIKTTMFHPLSRFHQFTTDAEGSTGKSHVCSILMVSQSQSSPCEC